MPRLPDDTVTVEEMAAMHDMESNWLRILLRREAGLPDDQRRIPGAYKSREGKRGDWIIPRASAEAFRRDPRGRPKRTD